MHTSPHEIFAHALSPFLGSQPTSTSTHSSANESISWFHSFHCCQTPSINPFLPSQQTSRGAERPRGEEGAVQRHLISYPLWFPSNMVFWWYVPVCMYSVCVCVWNEWEREGIKKWASRQDVFCSSSWYLTFLLLLWDYHVSSADNITGRLNIAGGGF